MMHRTFLATFLLAGLAATATAQTQCFNPNIGTALGAGDDTVSANNALGFVFPWPDGSTSTSIDIDSNGRIFQPGAAVSSYYPDVYDFIGGPTSIAPFWADLDPSDALSDDIYFFTDNVSTAVITWQDVVVKYDTQPLTIQVVLRSDGSIRFAYDERSTTLTGYYTFYGLPLTGVSPGNATNYNYGGSVDISQTLSAPFDSGTDPLVFENFYYNYYGSFDLDGFAFDYAPNGNGGYLLIGVDCGFARAESVGVGCFPLGSSFDWIADGSGGYVVTQGSSGFDPRAGASLGLGDDSISTQALGFSFTMPGGNVVTSIDVDSNGRVLEGGTGSSDFSATVAELLSSTSGVLCGFWTDINPGAAGDVTFFTDNAGFASVTWTDAPQFGQTNALTFQIQLRAPSEWSLVLSDVQSFASDDLLIGCSGGGGAADPGESDFSTTPILSNGASTVYEYFLVSEVFDLAGPPSIELVASTTPQLGGSFDLALTEIPSSTLQAAALLGTANPNLDLSLVFTGLPCFLLSNNNLGALNLSSFGWAPGMATGSLSIDLTSASPALLGIPLVLQGVIVDPSVPWSGTLPIATSNAVIGTIGN